MVLPIKLRIYLIERLLGKHIGIVRGAKIVGGQITGTEGVRYLDVAGLQSEGIGLLQTPGMKVNANQAVITNADKAFEVRFG